MTVSIIIGIIAFGLLVALFISKSRELSGKTTLLGGLNRSLHPWVIYGLSFGRTIEDHLEPARLRAVVLYSIVHGTNKVLELLRRWLGAVHHKFTTVAQVMQGREAVLKGGASSVFLKSIAEHKKKIQEDTTRMR